MGEHVIDIGPRVPRASHPVLRRIAAALLRLAGWRLDVHFPDEPKLVVLGAPHTSNWDGVLAVFAVLALELRIGIFVKHTAFNSPLIGDILRGVGAVPIDRSAPGGIVAQTVAAFRERPQMVIAIAPEGTRRRVDKWKRGFHLIAQEAGVPMVLAYIDYRRKVVGTGFIVAGDLIVTCAHVVREALKEKKEQALRIEGGERIELLPREDLPDDQEPIVATVERELFTGARRSTATPAATGSRVSIGGRSSRSRNWRAYGLKLSTKRRCPSA